MWYEHEEYKLQLIDGKAKFYAKGQLMFKGDGYIAIKHLLRFTNNAEKVIKTLNKN